MVARIEFCLLLVLVVLAMRPAMATDYCPPGLQPHVTGGCVHECDLYPGRPHCHAWKSNHRRYRRYDYPGGHWGYDGGYGGYGGYGGRDYYPIYNGQYPSYPIYGGQGHGNVYPDPSYGPLLERAVGKIGYGIRARKSRDPWLRAAGEGSLWSGAAAIFGELITPTVPSGRRILGQSIYNRDLIIEDAENQSDWNREAMRRAGVPSSRDFSGRRAYYDCGSGECNY